MNRCSRWEVGDRNQDPCAVACDLTGGLNMKAVICAVMLVPVLFGADLKVRISWGHDSATAAPYYVRLAPGGLEIRDAAGYELESGEGFKGDAWQGAAGGGD